MEKKIADSFLQEMHEYSLQAGGIYIALDEEDFERLKGNIPAQILLLEEEAGAPLSMILKHQELYGHLQCAATTQRGDQCKHFVKGLWTRFPEWLKAHKERRLCFTHLDQTMNVEVE